MTVLNSESRLLATANTQLPRVNLLPPEIAEARAFRRIQLGLGATVVGALGVVGLLYLSATGSVSSAQSDLDEAQATNQRLQSQAATYKNVTAIYAAADAAQQQLSQAMGDEIRFSQLMSDISLSVPSNVWLTNVTYAQAPRTAATAATQATAAAAVAAGTTLAASPAGTFTVTGIAYSHNDVAVWLESIAGLKTYDSPYFSNSTEALIGTRRVVNWSSTANLTPAALSGRYLKPAGS